MTKIDQSRLITIRKLSTNQLITEEPDEVALEEPLEIRIRGNAIATTMRTPGNDIDLVAGFISTEGIIKKRSDILEIAHTNILRHIFLGGVPEHQIEQHYCS